MREEDLGVAMVKGVGAVRRLRYETLNDVEWCNPHSDRRVVVTVPQSQVVFVKMHAH